MALRKLNGLLFGNLSVETIVSVGGIFYPWNFIIPDFFCYLLLTVKLFTFFI